ncbi:MAG: polymer-forming cytoskeletal protein [Thermomicrobiales bacterium]|nr:polymer-forming cytoskeletal protein [Thermomicrobiales bacterium]
MRSADATEFAQDYSGENPDQSESSYSVIDRHSIFDGTFQANRNLRIEGEVKGTIECRGTLFVAQGANVSAKVEAESITVAGDLNGDIRCQGRLQIMPSGRVRGKVTTVTLVINEGAYYEGQLEMTPPDERPASAAPRPIAAVTPPVQITPNQPSGRPASGATGESGGGNSSTFIRRLGGPETPWDNRAENEQDDEEGT